MGAAELDPHPAPRDTCGQLLIPALVSFGVLGFPGVPTMLSQAGCLKPQEFTVSALGTTQALPLPLWFPAVFSYLCPEVPVQGQDPPKPGRPRLTFVASAET